LQTSIFVASAESISKGRATAPDDVLADKVNLLRSLLADREARGAAKDARITRLFLQCREHMSVPEKAVQQPRKGCQRNW
jgi:hypothetical protein